MMVKKSANPSGSTKEGLEVELSGLFGTLGNAVNLLGKLTEAGVKHLQHQDEFTLKGLGDGARGVYGFSIRTGRGGQGADRIERFGNIHATTEGVVVDDVHEPLVDVFDEGSEIVVTVELPGARENEIKVEQRDALLAIESQGERRYAKEVLLPGAIDGNSLQKKYNNGVLEIRARKV
jgi:HSP20 family protein